MYDGRSSPFRDRRYDSTTKVSLGMDASNRLSSNTPSSRPKCTSTVKKGEMEHVSSRRFFLVVWIFGKELGEGEDERYSHDTLFYVILRHHEGDAKMR